MRLEGGLLVGKFRKSPILSAYFANNSSIDSETAAKSIRSLNIFYNTLSYTLTSESPKMDIVSLCASIGGHLGLFMGISVFSLGEILQVIIEYALMSKKYN